VGTGLTGLECAEMVLEKGCSLTMVEMLPTVGQGIYNVIFNDTMSRIKPRDPVILPGHQLAAVTESGVEVRELATGEMKSIAADTVILSLGTHDQQAMLAAYEEAGLNAVLVGSADAPGRIAGAIRGGFEKAWVFETE
jgi:pyruvate/2-oxoglutarate dehydrogenase complex dihydrolipoamide dehydrogenase (E3) component